MAEAVLSFDDDGSFERFAWDLSAMGVKALAGAPGIVRHHGMLLQTRVRARASHPRSQDDLKPRIQTGDYVRSITLHLSGLSAIVGTNRPQGRRLEFGFTGIDALGRNYDQPPYEHFRPALLETGPGFILAMAALARG